jgi:transcriptional regulator with XRE-family HTH domain
MTLGEKLKALREARGWSQQELARRSGVRQALLSELELGKKEDTTGRNLRRLARALHVSVDYLVGMYNGPPDPRGRPGEELTLDGSAPLPATIPL